MIGYLKGKVIYSNTECVILDVNGVGYEVYCSGSAYSKLVSNREGEVFTYLQASENTGITLFGFDSIFEKEIFLKLITVSGVGAKSAIGILTKMNAGELSAAIASADIKKLTAVKGLGKKTAEKIVLELHGKISASEVISAGGGEIAADSASALSAEDEDAVSALMSLGFTRNESLNAVKRARGKGASTVEEVIRTALSGM